MIVSNLKNSARIEALHPLFKKLFDYVKNHNLSEKELGKIILDGDDLYINNASLECVSEKNQKLEVHRDYIDVHILLDGHERIGWKSLEDCKELIHPYDDKGDFALYTDKPSVFVDVKPGEFVVVYPEDAHAPAIGSGKIRKLIAKIKL